MTETLPVNQLAWQYATSLRLSFKGDTHLDFRGVDMPEFHNNLVVESQQHALLICANRSKLYIYQVDCLSGEVNPRAYAELETKPDILKESYISGANWPGDPHKLNFIKLATVYHTTKKQITRYCEILITAGDDGRVLLFKVEDFLIKGKNARAFAITETSASAWGLSVQKSHNLLAVSNNSRHVVIYKIPVKAAFSSRRHLGDPLVMKPLIVSPDLKKNIPDVDFVQNDITDTCHVAAISISGEVAVWEFYYGDVLASYKPAKWTKPRNNSGYSSATHSSKISSGATSRDTITSGQSLESDYYHSPSLDASVSLEDTDILVNPNSRLWNDLALAYVNPSGRASTLVGHEEDYHAESVHNVDEDIAFEYEGFSDASDPDSDYDDHVERQVRTSKYGPCVVYENLKQQGWTVNVVDSTDFKHVCTFFEATSNKWLVESTVFKQILANNPKINEGRGDDDIHPSSKISCLEIETVPSQSSHKALWSAVAHTPHYSLPLCSKTSKAAARSQNQNQHQNQNRNQKIQSSNQGNSTYKECLNDKFVILTSQKSIYLCQLQDLHCNAATANVFHWQPSLGLQETYFDRMSIVHVIPSMSAVIVVSQIGAVSVFRLVCYKGIYTIRQEYCFPELEPFSFSETALRVVGGVTVKELKDNHGIVNRARIRIIYVDGFLLKYDLSFADSSAPSMIGEYVV